MRNLYQNYPWSAEVPEENAAFDHIRLTAFHRDTEDKINPETGEVWPATFEYYGRILAVRKRDGTFFYVNMTLDKDFAEWPEEKQQSYLDSKVIISMMFLNTFADCACTEQQPCPRH
jgi:hypothetical protein